jgi:hypothetical protein
VALYETSHHFTVGVDRGHGGLFIICHEAAVAFDISAEDSGELAFKALFSDGITSLLPLKGME